MTITVAVLMGGPSAERAVSLSSGEPCARALEAEGYAVARVVVGPAVADLAALPAQLAAARPDVVFNALHGRFGEDGTVQGLLEALRLPYTHSGVLASALAMDKPRAKLVAQAAGVSVARGLVMDRREAARAHPMAPPYVVKPAAEGSSVGVVIVREGRAHPAQELAREDWPVGDLVLVEEFVPGRELTCAVMGDRSLGVTEIRSTTGLFYDYDAKYAPGGSVHECPAKLKPDVYQEAQGMAVRAHEALGCRGVSRSDFRFDEASGRLVWLEVNTQPGMTETSLVPELAAHAGLSFGGLVRWMVEDASVDR